MHVRDFSFAPAFQGGGLIALAALVFLVMANKRTGISGLFGSGFLRALKGEPLDLVSSTFIGAFLLAALTAQQRIFPDGMPAALPLNLPAYALGGLLTGFGTKLGNGCTSGHGVCGLTRVSKRGFTAVCTFMAVGMAVAHVLGQLQPDPLRAPGGGSTQWDRRLDTWPALQQPWLPQPWTAAVGALSAFLLLWGLPRKLKDTPLVHLSAAVSGALFAVGLQRSGMVEQAKVLGFLHVLGAKGWDPSLMVVLGAAVGLLLPPTLWVLGTMDHALGDPKTKIYRGVTAWEASKGEQVDARLVVGEALFGVGWGMVGICPGPALCMLASGAPRVVLAFFPAYVAGWLLVDVVAGGQGKATAAGKKKGK